VPNVIGSPKTLSARESRVISVEPWTRRSGTLYWKWKIAHHVQAAGHFSCLDYFAAKLLWLDSLRCERLTSLLLSLQFSLLFPGRNYWATDDCVGSSARRISIVL